MSKYALLQTEHQRLLERKEAGESAPELLRAVQDYIEHCKSEAADVSDPRDRSQLRANLRYWGSYVFEQTGLYPDTTLLPAKIDAGVKENVVKGLQGLPASPFYRQTVFWLGLASIILLIGIIATWSRLPAIFQHQSPTPGTPTGHAMGQTVTPTKTPKPTKTTPPLPTSTIAPATLESFAATASALRTLAAAVSQTPFPSRTILPETGGGGIEEFVWLKADVTSFAHPQDCFNRALYLRVDSHDAFTRLNLRPARIAISQPGDLKPVATGDLTWDGKETVFNIPSSGPDLLLVQVDYPGLVFDTVIVQFLPDCSRDHTTIAYHLEAEIEKAKDYLAQVANLPLPVLALNWRLETWGPNPFSPGWIAVLTLYAEGGDGNYIYWASDLSTESNLPLPDNQVTAQAQNCERAFINVGVTSAGQSLARPLILLSPACPETISPPVASPSRTATPTSKTPAIVEGMRFTIQNGSPAAISGEISHPGLGCSWMGVGGQVLDAQAEPLIGLIVELGGELAGNPLETQLTLSGSAPIYGPGGFEFTLTNRPIASQGTLYLQLLDMSGKPLSERVYFDTFEDCARNLILIFFIPAN